MDERMGETLWIAVNADNVPDLATLHVDESGCIEMMDEIGLMDFEPRRCTLCIHKADEPQPKPRPPGAGRAAEREREDLATRIVGLEKMLCDSQQEAERLRAELAEYRLFVENVECCSETDEIGVLKVIAERLLSTGKIAALSGKPASAKE